MGVSYGEFLREIVAPLVDFIIEIQSLRILLRKIHLTNGVPTKYGFAGQNAQGRLTLPS